jgi:hypothetical protein
MCVPFLHYMCNDMCKKNTPNEPGFMQFAQMDTSLSMKNTIAASINAPELKIWGFLRHVTYDFRLPKTRSCLIQLVPFPLSARHCPSELLYSLAVSRLVPLFGVFAQAYAYIYICAFAYELAHFFLCPQSNAVCAIAANAKRVCPVFVAIFSRSSLFCRLFFARGDLQLQRFVQVSVFQRPLHVMLSRKNAHLCCLVLSVKPNRLLNLSEP